MENKEHIEFFNQLLEKTKTAFHNSDVYKTYGNKNWGYSVTATSFKKNAKVIVGFNWGAGKNWKVPEGSDGSQEKYPLKDFLSSYNDLGSMKRTIPFFRKYFDTIPEVQANYCFFRSETESQISPADLLLSSKLFDELINYLEPSMLISFSKSLNDYFEQTGKLLNVKTLEISSVNKRFKVTSGKVKIADKEIDYYNLPHPNYPVTSGAREKAWDFLF